jgi:hypothetical protein
MIGNLRLVNSTVLFSMKGIADKRIYASADGLMRLILNCHFASSGSHRPNFFKSYQFILYQYDNFALRMTRIVLKINLNQDRNSSMDVLKKSEKDAKKIPHHLVIDASTTTREAGGLNLSAALWRTNSKARQCFRR